LLNRDKKEQTVAEKLAESLRAVVSGNGHDKDEEAMENLVSMVSHAAEITHGVDYKAEKILRKLS